MKFARFWGLFLLLPLAFGYWIYQYAVRGWFWSDDFAWLSLHLQLYNREWFLRAMFEPMAQGTIRPWSERGFFLLFFKLFGFDALPYHLCALGTQFANMLLLAWIVRKLGGSRFAACVAPALWVANAAMVLPLGWASDYNQILCAFFLLSAFALFLAGKYRLQFAVFVLGFGALEINIVYPAILLAWLLLNRKSPKPALPLFAVSAVYYLVHRHFAPASSSGPYALHADLSLFSTLFRYCAQTVLPEAWYTLPRHRPVFAIFALAALALSAAFFAYRTGRIGLFFAAWFLVTLAPVLPLRDHFTDYYLAIPSLALAAFLALGLDTPLPGKPLYRFALAFPALLYLWIHVPVARSVTHWNYAKSREVRTLVLGVVRAAELHPGRTILLRGVPPDLYAFSVAHSPFHAAGLDQVYLTPETEFATYPGLEPPSAFRLPGGPTLYGLAADRVEVYQPAGERIRNVTASYREWARKNIPNSVPERLDVGVPLMAYLLGSTWYPLEGNHRWMPDVATVRIAAPRAPNQKLVLTGYCPQDRTRLGPLTLQISIDGKKVSVTQFGEPEMPFARTIDLPSSLVGKPEMEVGLAVSGAFQTDPGARRLGLAFGTFEVR